ncbi:hypothetical protein IQ07DRAFT_638971 [Pyrenochaeta sp. DS3sAY3a]|nr:hypothetical protein IQ07DRAFT_638971 [Pyrenochaeta sp. DS3sAY3a]
MTVDARDMSYHPSSTVHDKNPVLFAIAVTLASTALLTFSLRVYTRAKVLRCFHIDDWIALVVALLTIGTTITFALLANLDFEKQPWSESPSRIQLSKLHLWMWISSILCTLGINFIKFSMTLYLLRVFEHKYCRHLLYFTISLVLPLTLVWFGSQLFQCVPASAVWSLYPDSGARCMPLSMERTFALVNNSINAAIDLMLTLLLLPIMFSPLKSATRAFLVATLCFGVVACIAAIIRAWMVYDWGVETEHSPHQGVIFIFWSIVELNVALTAASIPSLELFIDQISVKFKKQPESELRTPPSAPQTNQSSQNSRYSSQTVIYRPNTAYNPSFTRFHDDVSNLDFDIETPASRSRTQTLRSRGNHSRNVSDWSQFSGFTYYTNPAEPPEIEPSRMRSADASATELSEIIKGLGLGSNDKSEQDIGLALTAMHATLPHERGEGPAPEGNGAVKAVEIKGGSVRGRGK